MPITGPPTSASWTHRAYYKQYRLNVEQYGEILVAHAFRGEKKGDAQPCYDVETTESNVRIGLLSAAATPAAIESCLATDTGGGIRIEVKSKQARTASGKADVVYCQNKLEEVRRHSPATHFAVILFDGEGNGTAEEAWFFTAGVAGQLLRGKTGRAYISVRDVRKAISEGVGGLIGIRTLIDHAATTELTIS